MTACDRRVVEVNQEAPATEERKIDIYDLSAENLSGERISLDDYRGKVTLVVNVASQCGFTPQYTQLQELQETWKDRGFSVIAFPCNDFGGQEPGDSKAIEQTCRVDYKTTFPVMSKVQVKQGPGQSPIYAQLEEATGVLPRWNFGKYLVNGKGEPVAFFGSSVKPMSEKIQQAIEESMN
ncbi:MAG: glutathione peroxidase [Phycisphaerae bacterium]|nr:glutathione peroxidase [Phycisphaerae bacterium]